MGAEKLLFVEPVRHGEEHQPFNTSILLSCAREFPGAEIFFAAHASHWTAVQSWLPPEASIHFVPLNVPKREGGAFSRACGGWGVLESVKKVLRGKGIDRVIFLSITREMMWFLNLRSVKRRMPFSIAVLHGGLAQDLRVPRFNCFERAISLRNAMKSSPANIRFAVLETPISKELVRRVPDLDGRVSVLPHPLPTDLMFHEPVEEKDKKDAVHVGLLGLCTPQKGLFRFLRLAKYAHDNGVSGVRFEIVGRLHEDSVSAARPFMNYLWRQPSADRVPRHEFVRSVSILDYGAFLFEGNHYEMTASGVLLDCVGLGVPLVKSENILFRSLEAEVGKIGLTLPEEPEAAIRQIMEDSNESYRLMRENIMALRGCRGGEATGQRIRDILGL